MKKAVVTLVLIIPFLHGCALFDFSKKKDDVPIVPPGTEIKIDPRVYEPCKDFVQIDKAKVATPDEIPFAVLANMKQNKVILDECSQKQKEAVSILKQVSGAKSK